MRFYSESGVFFIRIFLFVRYFRIKYNFLYYENKDPLGFVVF